MKDVALGDDINRHLTKVEVQVTGKRYCTSCGKQQAAEGGENRKYRWVCAACVFRRNNKIRSWSKEER